MRDLTDDERRRLRMLQANLRRARQRFQLRAELNKTREITEICDAAGCSATGWLA